MKKINYKMLYKSLMAYQILSRAEKWSTKSKRSVSFILCESANQNELKKELEPRFNALKFLQDNGFIAEFTCPRGRFVGKKKNDPDTIAIYATVKISDILDREKLKELSKKIDWPGILDKKQKGNIYSLKVDRTKRKVVVNSRAHDYYIAKRGININFDLLCLIAQNGPIPFNDKKEYIKKYKSFVDYYNSNSNCPLYRKSTLYYAKTKIFKVDEQKQMIIPLIKIKITDL